MPVDASLLEILACPACHAPLRESEDGAAGAAGEGDPAGPELRCTSDTCGLVYPVRDEIPVLLVDEARRPA
ncbi:Trm112 family protein [Streptomyces sp. MAR4 CNX-425]|uniref:Trm112 family protein n=1 Tax=Streptomyces sp. MAR4 CNX-425 TaxID=3406343 RepID=UPI003B504B1B